MGSEIDLEIVVVFYVYFVLYITSKSSLDMGMVIRMHRVSCLELDIIVSDHYLEIDLEIVVDFFAIFALPMMS